MARLRKLLTQPRSFVRDAVLLEMAKVALWRAVLPRRQSREPTHAYVTRHLLARTGLLLYGSEGTRVIGVPESARALVAALLTRTDRRPRGPDAQRRSRSVWRVGIDGGERLELELWRREPTRWCSPRPNGVADHLYRRDVEPFIRGQQVELKAICGGPPPKYRERDRLEGEFAGSVDVVFTWVNGQDPQWQALYRDTFGVPPDEAHQYRNRDELRYALRSVEAHASWRSRVFVVSNCSPPPWLEASHPHVQWVPHETILPRGALPTFNSHAIEARLHHIPDLAEHFVYFNDDMFLCRPTTKSTFFSEHGCPVIHLEDAATATGTVSGCDPPWLNAARNGRDLLERDFRKVATRLHRHVPYSLRRSILGELEATFPAVREVWYRKVRSAADVSVASFLAHHYAAMTDRAMIGQMTSRNLSPSLSAMSWLARPEGLPVVLCINDSASASAVPGWDWSVRSFLDRMFPGWPEHWNGGVR